MDERHISASVFLRFSALLRDAVSLCICALRCNSREAQTIPNSPPIGLLHIGIQAIDIGLHLLAGALINDLSSQRAAGVSRARARGRQCAPHAVLAFTE